MEEAKIQGQSPIIEEAIVKEREMDFYEALKEIVDSKKVTKLEWGDKEFYGLLEDTKLKLHKPDGKTYDWILTDGDLLGTDYITIN
jgi:hypothetical protein